MTNRIDKYLLFMVTKQCLHSLLWIAMIATTMVGCEKISNKIFKKSSKTFAISNDKKMSEQEGQVTITYTLDAPADEITKVTWSTIDGTAKHDEGDYTACSQMETTIPPGELEALINIPVHDDNLHENDEYFKIIVTSETLTLSQEQESEALSQELEITITIIDNDGPPAIYLERDTHGIEGDGHINIRYTLTSASEQEMSFLWLTKNGNARSGDDYTAMNQQEYITPGAVDGTLSIPISDDSLGEHNENFKVIIISSSLSGLDIERSQLHSTVSIIDDDGGPPSTASILNPPSTTVKTTTATATATKSKSLSSANTKDTPTIFLESDANVREGNGHVIIHYILTSASEQKTGFWWRTHQVSAQSDDDYTPMKKWESITPGATDGILMIPIQDDALEENNEVFNVSIISSSLLGLDNKDGRLQSTITIIDNDYTLPASTNFDFSSVESKPIPSDGNSLPVIHLEVDAFSSESDCYITVSYILSSASKQATGFWWWTNSGSAHSNIDYINQNKWEHIPPGTSSGTLSIPIYDDSLNEGKERFEVNIIRSSLLGLRSEKNLLQSIITIIDNDILLPDDIIIDDSNGDTIQDATTLGSLTTTCPHNKVIVSHYYNLEELAIPADILWVIDNSGSMGTYHKNLIQNMDIFINNFAHKSQLVPWKMGLLSTSSNDDPYIGFTPNNLLDSTTVNPVDKFNGAISRLGTNGDGTEKSFAPIRSTFQSYPDFLREDSRLFIIFISDEDEQSSISVEGFLEFLKSLRPLASISAYGVLKEGNCGNSNFKGSRYDRFMMQLTRSITYSICSDDYGLVLSDLSEDIAKKLTTSKIHLTSIPIAETIQVFYDEEVIPNGIASQGGFWLYNALENTISFHDLSFLREEDDINEIKVTFEEMPSM